MPTPRRVCLTAAFAAMMMVTVFSTGCAHRSEIVIAPPDVPRELSKLTLPEYIVEPPDILQIDALQVVPLSPYHVKSLDALGIRVPKALVDEPISGVYPVDPDGTVNLGLTYGKVKVIGMTLEEAQKAIEKQLSTVLKEPRTEVSLVESRAMEQIRGPHLVRPDGTVSLGIYGSVQVTGMTLTEVKHAIEAHLSAFLQSPEVSVDVAAYNSKVFYVIYDQGGSGQQVMRLPITGNETVLDAVSQLNGLSPVSDLRQIWVARPTDPCQSMGDTILPVDWVGVTANGRPETNYQLMPGDRLFVKADRMVTIDTRLGRLFAPIERVFGITLLGTSTAKSIKFFNSAVGGGF